MDVPETLFTVIAFITPFAAVDALVILPATLATIAPLLASRRPILVASAYTLGLFVGGVASGVLAAIALQEITCWIVDNIDAISRPGPIFYVVQTAIGLGLIAMGIKLFRPRPPKSPESDDKSEARGMTLIVVGAFTLAAVGMFIRLPAALPYLAMIDRLLIMWTPSTTKLIGLAYHNLVLAAPYALLIVLYLIAPARGERVLARVQHWMRTWGRKILAILLIALGLVLAADGVGRPLGHPVLPVIETRDQQSTSPCSADSAILPTAVGGD